MSLRDKDSAAGPHYLSKCLSILPPKVEILVITHKFAGLI